MKHSFRMKKGSLKTVFNDKLNFSSLSVENSDDVQNSINTVLMYIELEDYLEPVSCSYNFINTNISFELELNKAKDKKDFFEAIKKFEDFIDA